MEEALVLGADLVRARRRGERLHLQPLKGGDLERAKEISAELIRCSQESVGETLEELNDTLSMVAREAREEKLWAGLKKLLLDRCEFGSPLTIDAPELRRQLFELSARERQEAESVEDFSRDKLLAQLAEQVSVTVEEIEAGLFSDLKGAQRLQAAPRVCADELVEVYELAQIQGVLLKAVRLTALVRCASPDSYRRLFQKLKFRRLLYRLTPLSAGGYRLEIDGPFSLFESVTKYGLNLALIVPALRECDEVELDAELKWGKERRPLEFQDKWKKPYKVSASEDGEELRPEVSALLRAFKKKSSPYQVGVAQELLEVPGVGLCVPDLKFQVPGAEPIYLEVLGFWSREAVFRRVEWAQSKGSARVIFCVSTKLRVSREVLDEASGSSLHIYKGTISAAAILAQLESLSERA